MENTCFLKTDGNKLFLIKIKDIILLACLESNDFGCNGS